VCQGEKDVGGHSIEPSLLRALFEGLGGGVTRVMQGDYTRITTLHYMRALFEKANLKVDQGELSEWEREREREREKESKTKREKGTGRKVGGRGGG